jgi:hypothetical protein
LTLVELLAEKSDENAKKKVCLIRKQEKKVLARSYYMAICIDHIINSSLLALERRKFLKLKKFVFKIN